MNFAALVSLFVTAVLAGLIFWILIWFIDYVGVPEPFNKVLKVLVALAAVVYLIGVLTGKAPGLALPI